VAEEIDLDAVTPHLRRGDDDALREQLERGLEILESDELKHGFRVTSGPQLSQKKQSALFRGICLRRLTTWTEEEVRAPLIGNKDGFFDTQVCVMTRTAQPWSCSRVGLFYLYQYGFTRLCEKHYLLVATTSKPTCLNKH